MKRRKYDRIQIERHIESEKQTGIHIWINSRNRFVKRIPMAYIEYVGVLDQQVGKEGSSLKEISYYLGL